MKKIAELLTKEENAPLELSTGIKDKVKVVIPASRYGQILKAIDNLTIMDAFVDAENILHIESAEGTAVLIDVYKWPKTLHTVLSEILGKQKIKIIF